MALIIAILFISGCAAQQEKPAQTSAPSVSPITTSPSPTAPEKHFTIKPQTPPIALTQDIESKVGQIADCYFTKTQKPLTVTSGTRGSSAQSQAMFDKLKLGDNLSIYRNKVALNEIKKVYTDSVAAGKGDEEIVADMAAVIDDQIGSGVYISRHLISGAVDFSQQGMAADDRTAFETCAKSTKGVSNVLNESKPIHFHIEITTSVSLATFTTSMAGDGYGEIVSTPEKCDVECELSVGSRVTLTAVPDDDSKFEGWDGDCSGTGICVLTMDKDKNVTARFKLKELPSITPTITSSPSLTPTQSPTQQIEVSVTVNTVECKWGARKQVDPNNAYWFHRDGTFTASGTASGPVGTVIHLYTTDHTLTCDGWTKTGNGSGNEKCKRTEGQPETTSWNSRRDLPNFDAGIAEGSWTTQGVTIEILDPEYKQADKSATCSFG